VADPQQLAVGQTVDANGNPIAAPASSARPLTVGSIVDANGNPVSGGTAAPAPSVFRSIADDMEDVGTGALKATGQTATNLLKVADWLFNGSVGHPVLNALSAKIGQPTGTAQHVGALGADLATALLPAGAIGEAGEAAAAGTEALTGSKLLGTAARVGTQAAAGGATSAAQGGSPTVGAVLGGGTATVGAAADALAPMVRSSAAKTMIRALGPTGGRGPTSAANLAGAEEIAPDLVSQGFGAATQAGARAQAQAALDQTGQDLQALLKGPEGAQAFDQPSLLQAVQAKRAGLLVDPGNGQPAYLPAGKASADAIYADLESDVGRLGSDPSTKAVHDLKTRWNDMVNWDATDSAAGTTNDVYSKGGNLIRAQMGTDATAISDADQAFHKASTLNDILNAPNVRRPGAGVLASIAPYARPAGAAVTGGYVGYREGGPEGAVAGALTGAALGNLIQSPGFRYASAALKNQLANALDKGNSALASQLAAVIARQISSSGGGS
jgi:hypothetical protein